MRTWQNSHPGGKLSIVIYVLCLIVFWLYTSFRLYSDLCFLSGKKKIVFNTKSMPCQARLCWLIILRIYVHAYIKLYPYDFVYTSCNKELL